jgi:hypothetical protein
MKIKPAMQVGFIYFFILKEADRKVSLFSIY